jgi:REP element-mobilizing transposase RayT
MGKSRGEFKTWGKSRSVRLEGFDYSTCNTAYHVIIGSKGKRAVFTQDVRNKVVIEVLKTGCDLDGFTLVAYCLIPNHLHILVGAGKGSSRLPFFVRAFKSFASRRAGEKLWQRGYYEHVMRSDESLRTVAEYILDNPVRKGIVESRGEYGWGWCVYDGNDKRPSSQEWGRYTSPPHTKGVDRCR